MHYAFICMMFATLYAPSIAENCDVTVWCVLSTFIKLAFTTALNGTYFILYKQIGYIHTIKYVQF